MIFTHEAVCFCAESDNDVAQRVQSFKLQTRNVRGQGAEPLAFSWGFKGAILSRERMAPFIRTPCAAAGNPFAPYGATI